MGVRKKKCKTCNKSFPLTSFSRDRSRSDKHQKSCKSCFKRWHSRHYKKHKETTRKKHATYRHDHHATYLNSKFKNTYGITYDERNQMMEWQNNECAVCRCLEGKRKFHIDHDHRTGQIRMMLCNGCNTGNGITDNIELLIAKSEYLSVYTTSDCS